VAVPAVDPHTRELLEWVGLRPRTYAEASAAWTSTCPRITPWEDAQIAGLVRVEGAGPRARVLLTSHGRAAARR
jgi:hypothetical protein